MKILVVEDEPLIRLGMASLLEEAGYEVIEAANASEAIAKLERDTTVSLVLTDVDMPGGMDGVRLANYVYNRWPPIRLIVISGKVGVSLSELPPGSRFFRKPTADTMLLNALRELTGPGDAA